MSNTYAASASAAALVAAALMPIGVAGSDGPGGPLPSSKGIATPTVVGTVTSPNGAPLVSARVELVAFPVGKALDAIEDGDTVPTKVFAEGLTDSAGHYALSVTDPAVLKYADADGNVNFEVEVFGEGVANSESVVAKPHVRSKDQAATDTEGPTLVNLTTHTATDVTPSTSTATVSDRPTCVWTKVKTLGQRTVSLGQAYTGPVATASFAFKSGASTTIGVGVAYGGSTWSASGETTVSSSAAVGFPKVGHNVRRIFRTSYVFAEYRLSCTGQRKVRATTFAGGTIYATPTKTPAVKTTRCTHYKANAKFTGNRSVATTFATGASLAGDIGLNLKSQSGYTTTTSLTFTFTSAGWLCGVYDVPGGAPGILVAKS